jgi:hypothetical protein
LAKLGTMLTSLVREFLTRKSEIDRYSTFSRFNTLGCSALACWSSSGREAL